MFIQRDTRTISRVLLALTSAVAVGLVSACGTALAAIPPATGDEQDSPRGAMLSVTPAEDLSADEVAARLRTAEIDSGGVRYGVTAYSVVYSTVDVGGEPTTASQLVALPQNEESDLHLVSWLHGTTLESVRHPRGILRQKLRAMDTTCDWHPDVPVHIFHASGDRDVAFEHARHCRHQLIAKGAEQRLTDVGDIDHNGTVRAALPRVARDFSQRG